MSKKYSIFLFYKYIRYLNIYVQFVHIILYCIGIKVVHHLSFNINVFFFIKLDGSIVTIFCLSITYI